MARMVEVDALRYRTDYRLKCGHQGESRKARWQRVGSPGPMLCNECPDEPKPAEPECDHECHRRAWNFHSWRYCPRCGGALTKEG